MIWPILKLEKIAAKEKGSIVSGPFGSSISAKYFVEEGVPVIRGNNLTKGARKFIDDGFVFLTETKAQEFRKCIALKDDIVFTAVGSIGQVGIIPENTKFEKYVISNKQLRVRIDKLEADPMFVYYWLSSPRITSFIEGMNNGGAVPLINLGIIRRIPVPKPPLKIQIKISSLISNYDDLINLNRRRIELLEESARLLFREWFVYFRFPGHENHKIIDGVPEGWRKGKVKDLGMVITGKTPSKQDSRNFDGNMPFIKTPDMHHSSIILKTEDTLSEIGAKSQNNKNLPPWSILVSCIGSVGVVAMNFYESQTNQQINSVVPKSNYFRYYSFFCLSRLKPMLEAIGGGSTMANINKSKFENIKIVIPTKDILEKFDVTLDPFFNQIALLLDQNQKLAQARDLLLPRLMSGEIDINDLKLN